MVVYLNRLLDTRSFSLEREKNTKRTYPRAQFSSDSLFFEKKLKKTTGEIPGNEAADAPKCFCSSVAHASNNTTKCFLFFFLIVRRFVPVGSAALNLRVDPEIGSSKQ